MQFYRLKATEMDTLPHWEFENKNYPSHPGRSYSHEGVLMLVSRKHAMLAGLHEKGSASMSSLGKERSCSIKSMNSLIFSTIFL